MCTTRCKWLPVPRRAFSCMTHSPNDLFEYTSGQWLINNALRHAERRRVFNVQGLCQLAAESVNRSADDIVNFAKLAQGGFNRTFLITMRDGFQMVARVPYLNTVPRDLAVASEVATMDLLRTSGLPIPEVYGYSPVPDNAAETEYIFMEFLRGTKLSDVWFDLGEAEIHSVVRELDLEQVAGVPGIPLPEDRRFCVGPDTRLPLWFGRRSQLDVDRGPYESAEAALVSGARKELAYLERFGQPLLPFQRLRRKAYQFQEQSPLDHVKNLERCLLIASSLVPKDPALCHFRIRHPDFQPSNVIVSRSPGSDWKVVGLLDWQHASILPLFLLAGIPGRFQNYNDPVSQSMTPPSLPKDFDDLDEVKQSRAKELYRRRLVHYHYVNNTEEWNEPHHAALTAPLGTLRLRLFIHSSELWEGETVALKVALIDAARTWKTLTGGDAPCPIAKFDAEDVRETRALGAVQREADEAWEGFQDAICCGSDGWVSNEHYETAMALCKKAKEYGLEVAESAEERDEIMDHWIMDDMDEEKYM
ncbi:protein kinase subdomain-containing protein PKL/CAK/Fmp29 [Lentinus tigrinus ALCF2SS1-7]|uniref:protein kinase subdomain-containing protein PKL/CAK/Fmp29 n=1 Tax=Lentinus tigrinus ALCF2SS1-7 TaxID=1328758 RepID=UPI001165CC06|nr:protein kinase subdomain-containing protein PKL/CAK/Fmp29 [Lentinus tigrinus ALCF2SS1-7]